MTTVAIIWLCVMLVLLLAHDYCITVQLTTMERLAWYDAPQTMENIHGSYDKWLAKRRRWQLIPILMPTGIFEPDVKRGGSHGE